MKKLDSHLGSFCRGIICTDAVDRCPTGTSVRPHSPEDTAQHTASPGSVSGGHKAGPTPVPDLKYK